MCIYIVYFPYDTMPNPSNPAEKRVVQPPDPLPQTSLERSWRPGSRPWTFSLHACPWEATLCLLRFYQKFPYVYHMFTRTICLQYMFYIVLPSICLQYVYHIFTSNAGVSSSSVSSKQSVVEKIWTGRLGNPDMIGWREGSWIGHMIGKRDKIW